MDPDHTGLRFAGRHTKDVGLDFAALDHLVNVGLVARHG